METNSFNKIESLLEAFLCSHIKSSEVIHNADIYFDSEKAIVLYVNENGSYNPTIKDKKFYILQQNETYSSSLRGYVLGKYNINVYIALRALLAFKEISKEEYVEYFKLLSENELDIRNKSEISELRSKAAKLGFNIVKK